MCYFVEINLSRQQLEKRFNVPSLHDPRYMEANLLSAFTRPFLPAITQTDPGNIRFLQWGLIPAWAKDRESAYKISNSTYNARSEGIFEKASFRSAVKNRRAMVLVHGFFEWHHKNKNEKIPYYIRRVDNRPFAMAGLSDSWTDHETGEIIETVSIVTTKANSLLERVHNNGKRMPVILREENEWDWLDQSAGKKDIEAMMIPARDEILTAHPVDRKLFLNHSDPKDPGLTKEYNPPENRGLFD